MEYGFSRHVNLVDNGEERYIVGEMGTWDLYAKEWYCPPNDSNWY